MAYEFTMKQIRDFAKKDFPSVSARFVKSLLLHYDNQISEVLIWYQSKSQEYRNNTLIEKCVEDFINERQKQ